MPAGTRIASTQTIGWVGQKIQGGAKAASIITRPSRRKRHPAQPYPASVAYPTNVAPICQCQSGGVVSYRRASGSERGWPGYFGDATRALAPGKRGTHCQYLNNRPGGPKNPGWGKGRVNNHPSVSAQTSSSSAVPNNEIPGASAARLLRRSKAHGSHPARVTRICQCQTRGVGGPKNPGWGKAASSLTHPSRRKRHPAQPDPASVAYPTNVAPICQCQSGGWFPIAEERQRARLARLLRRCNTRFSSWQAWNALPVLKQSAGWAKKSGVGQRPRHHSPIRLRANISQLRHTLHLAPGRQRNPAASPMQSPWFSPGKGHTHLPVSNKWGVDSYRRASGSERGWPGYFGDATRALAPGKRGTHCQYLNNRLGGPKNPGWGNSRVITHPSVSAQTSPGSGIPYIWPPAASATRLRRPCKTRFSQIVVLPLTSLKTPKPGSISRESCILSLPHPRGTWTIEE